MTFFGEMFGYDQRGNDLFGSNRDAAYNCVACGMSCDSHTAMQESICLARIFAQPKASETLNPAASATNPNDTNLKTGDLHEHMD